ncbi:hypothetical protein DMC61_27500 [Amycolatopsis sp. WAC 04169]|uniref:AMP-binding protein n=1 Tax=Amycolatopsis sp. WAC 04169 TaxID=2203197 RepID=UPI000F77B5C8|nr:AMP-binding protein [Amycolatopsis sp. WAC 04169]RSN25531.1 hypothetical protein DMC61_27500 [Amycolatopsis sp. WAC 04169]
MHHADLKIFLPDHVGYAEVNQAVGQVAHLLASRGIGRGDNVAVMSPNLPWFTIVYNGIFKAGATVVPLNVLLKSREVTYHLDDSDAVALFATEGSGRRLRRAHEAWSCRRASAVLRRADGQPLLSVRALQRRGRTVAAVELPQPLLAPELGWQ